MSWQDYTIPLIRNYIGDPAGTTYSDSRLTNIAITSAHSLLNEISFQNDYAIDVPSSSISPDPTSDSNFINLLSMKSALLIVNSEARTKSLQIFSIKDGPSSISTGESSKALLNLSKVLSDAYNKAKIDYIAGNSDGATSVAGPLCGPSKPSIFG